MSKCGLYRFVRSNNWNCFGCISSQRLWMSTTTTKSYDDIPGPSSLPFIGSMRHFLPGGSIGNKVGYELFDHFYKTYGPISKLDGMINIPSFVLLFDPEAIAQVHRGENNQPVRPGFDSIEYYRKVYSRKHEPDIKINTFKGSTGLITEHGENWKVFRSVVNPIMLQPKTIRLYKSALDEVADNFMHKIKEIRDEENMVNKANFDVEMNKWALESIGVVVLGGRIGCFEANLAEDSPARELIKTVHDIFRIGEQLDFKPSIWRYLSTPTFKEGMKAYSKQISLGKHFIQKAMKNIETKKYSVHEKGVLEKLLEVDENLAIIMATDTLLAGVDTAANTMLATMYLLAKNSEKQEKLRSEIINEGPGHYLRACIKESIRMMPVVSGNVRQTTKEYNLCGYHIPKNKRVVFPHQYLTLMEEQFPRAQEYIPERWLADKDDPLYYGNAHPFAMNPFGFGVRQCLGIRIAQLEFECFITNALRNFRIGWKGGQPNISVVALNYFSKPFDFTFDDV